MQIYFIDQLSPKLFLWNKCSLEESVSTIPHDLFHFIQKLHQTSSKNRLSGVVDEEGQTWPGLKKFCFLSSCTHSFSFPTSSWQTSSRTVFMWRCMGGLLKGRLMSYLFTTRGQWSLSAGLSLDRHRGNRHSDTLFRVLSLTIFYLLITKSRRHLFSTYQVEKLLPASHCFNSSLFIFCFTCAVILSILQSIQEVVRKKPVLDVNLWVKPRGRLKKEEQKYKRLFESNWTEASE